MPLISMLRKEYLETKATIKSLFMTAMILLVSSIIVIATNGNQSLLSIGMTANIVPAYTCVFAVQAMSTSFLQEKRQHMLEIIILKCSPLVILLAKTIIPMCIGLFSYLIVIVAMLILRTMNIEMMAYINFQFVFLLPMFMFLCCNLAVGVSIILKDAPTTSLISMIGSVGICAVGYYLLTEFTLGSAGVAIIVIGILLISVVLIKINCELLKNVFSIMKSKV